MNEYYRFLKSIVAITVLLGGVVLAAPARAQSLFPFTLACAPSDEGTNPTTPHGVEVGRKGMHFKFQCTKAGGPPVNGVTPQIPDPAGFPININAATAHLQIGANPEITATSPGGIGVNPAVNSISFTASGDTVSIYYNGNFPPATPVHYWVTGVVSANGIAQTAATPADPGTVTFLTGNDVPRPPRLVELVFDISGSMASPAVLPDATHPTPPTRIKALQDAAQIFLGVLPAYSWVGDKVGVVYFSTDAKIFDPTPGGSNMEAALDGAKVAQILANIQTQVPTNSTAIGKGLQLADTAGFKVEPSGPQKKIVVLFSDGEQNVPTPNYVSVSGNDVMIGTDKYTADTIIPITAGDISSMGNMLQSQIGTAKNPPHGSFHVVTDTDITTFFTQALQDIVVGDKVETVRDVAGTIARGADVPQKFLASSNDVALSILVTWSGTGRTHLPIRLRSPDGNDIDLTGKTQFGQNLSVTNLRFPQARGTAIVQAKGEWTIDLLGANLESQQLNYHLIVMLDSPTLASDFHIDASDVGTGEAVPVRVKLTDGGKPVLNAAVVAEIIGPSNGIGNILSTNAMPPGSPAQGGDAVRNDAQKKLLLLLADPSKASLFGTTGLPKITLLDNGQATNADAAANDGIYSASFTGTLKEGHYRLVVTALGKGANGDFQRVRTLTFFVRPKADPKKTSFTVLSANVQADGSQLVHLKLIPKDALDNFLGPDYIGHLNINAASATEDKALQDNLDGSYEISYRVPAATPDPKLTVVITGTTVIATTLNELKGIHPPPTVASSHLWLWILLIILILILLLWLVIRSKKTSP